jgi:transposase
MRWQPQAGGGRRREAIARRLGLNRKTVDQYLSLQAAPHRRHASRSVSALAPYEGYLLRRWAEGCRNARQVWREIREQGSAGAYRNVARIMGYLRQQERLGKTNTPASAALTPRRAVGVALLRPEERSADERRTNGGRSSR